MTGILPRTNPLRKLLQHRFVRNVAVMATGTGAAHAITLAFMPLITRLYGPEAMGVQGVFVSLITVLSTFAALAYPIAIVLPKADADARLLAQLSVGIALFIAVLLFGILLFQGAEILQRLGASAIAHLHWLVPISTFAVALNATINQWLIRKKRFSINAGSLGISTLATNVGKSVLGLFHPSSLMLVLTTTAGHLLNAAIALVWWKRSNLEANKAEMPTPTDRLKRMRELAAAHRDFPLLRMPQNLINAFSQALPPLILASLFGATSAGQYAVAAAALIAPSALIGNAVSSVFYPHVTELIQRGESAQKLLVKSTLAMAAVGAVPFLLVMLLGPLLFPLVFGSAWRDAGVYAQLLAPWLFLQFVNKPTVAALPPLQLQGGLLLYEIFSTGSKVVALWLGFRFFQNDRWAIGLFAAAGVIAYLWLIIWTIHQAGSKHVTRKASE